MPWAVAALALSIGLRGTAAAWSRQRVVGNSGLIHNWAERVVVPSVGIVIRDNDGRVLPVVAVLQRIDHVDDPELLVKWVGVTWMTVLKGSRFQIGNSGQAIFIQRRPEILQIILVVGAVSTRSDQAGVAGTGVVLIGRLSEILERFVVRNVVTASVNSVVPCQA